MNRCEHCGSIVIENVCYCSRSKEARNKENLAREKLIADMKRDNPQYIKYLKE